jgi:LL-H family phage holin
MNVLNATMITNIILVLLPFIATLAYYFCRLIEQRLPRHQADMLDRVVKYAVQMVEQQYSGAGGTAKKKLAENVIIDLLKSFGLPIPAVSAIDAALESTVFQLQQMPSVLAAKQGPTGQTQSAGMVANDASQSQMTFRPNFAYTPGAPMPTNAHADDATSMALRSWPGQMGTPAPNVITPGNVYTGNAMNPGQQSV